MPSFKSFVLFATPSVLIINISVAIPIRARTDSTAVVPFVASLASNSKYPPSGLSVALNLPEGHPSHDFVGESPQKIEVLHRRDEIGDSMLCRASDGHYFRLNALELLGSLPLDPVQALCGWLGNPHFFRLYDDVNYWEGTHVRGYSKTGTWNHLVYPSRPVGTEIVNKRGLNINDKERYMNEVKPGAKTSAMKWSVPHSVVGWLLGKFTDYVSITLTGNTLGGPQKSADQVRADMEAKAIRAEWEQMARIEKQRDTLAEMEQSAADEREDKIVETARKKEAKARKLEEKKRKEIEAVDQKAERIKQKERDEIEASNRKAAERLRAAEAKKAKQKAKEDLHHAKEEEKQRRKKDKADRKASKHRAKEEEKRRHRMEKENGKAQHEQH